MVNRGLGGEGELTAVMERMQGEICRNEGYLRWYGNLVQ